MSKLLESNENIKEWEIKFEKHCEKHHECNQLKETLLKIGGKRILLQFDQERPFFYNLITRGKEFRLEPLLERGITNECHFNCAKLAQSNEHLRIVLGWGLWADYWFLHSWLFSTAEILIETTELMDAYFGYILSKEEQEKYIQYHISNYEKRISYEN